MKKLFIFLVLLCGCCGKVATPTTIWYETKEWQVVNVREPMTQEEIKKCRFWGRDPLGVPIIVYYRIMIIKNGDEVKEIIVK